MIRTIAAVLFGLALAPAGVRAACDGAGPTVTSVTLHNMTHTRYLDLYHVTATVTNVGGSAQTADVLQFVDVAQYGSRLDDRGVPPLAPGQSYTVSYVWPRSADAGTGTSPLDFHVRRITGENAVCSTRVGSITI